MWANSFDARLASWYHLRQEATILDVETALTKINTWWFQTPWCAYHLHWDDYDTWPDPWQLLSDNIYCNLARGLGILYTIAILDRTDIQDAYLTEFGSDNLVQVAKKKYILNWDKDIIVNINPGDENLRRRVSQTQILQKIN